MSDLRSSKKESIAYVPPATRDKEGFTVDPSVVNLLGLSEIFSSCYGWASVKMGDEIVLKSPILARNIEVYLDFGDRKITLYAGTELRCASLCYSRNTLKLNTNPDKEINHMGTPCCYEMEAYFMHSSCMFGAINPVVLGIQKAVQDCGSCSRNANVLRPVATTFLIPSKRSPKISLWHCYECAVTQADAALSDYSAMLPSAAAGEEMPLPSDPVDPSIHLM